MKFLFYTIFFVDILLQIILFPPDFFCLDHFSLDSPFLTFKSQISSNKENSFQVEAVCQQGRYR